MPGSFDLLLGSGLSGWLTSETEHVSKIFSELARSWNTPRGNVICTSTALSVFLLLNFLNFLIRHGRWVRCWSCWTRVYEVKSFLSSYWTGFRSLSTHHRYLLRSSDNLIGLTATNKTLANASRNWSRWTGSILWLLRSSEYPVKKWSSVFLTCWVIFGQYLSRHISRTPSSWNLLGVNFPNASSYHRYFKFK
jgi:hypothetical protein